MIKNKIKQPIKDFWAYWVRCVPSHVLSNTDFTRAHRHQRWGIINHEES